jgi:hypothetical protein
MAGTSAMPACVVHFVGVERRMIIAVALAWMVQLESPRTSSATSSWYAVELDRVEVLEVVVDEDLRHRAVLLEAFNASGTCT